MITIIDLDYTMLDTKKFKEDMASLFGMSTKEWGDSYRRHFKDKKINYNLEKHLDILHEEGLVKNKAEAEKIKKSFNEFFDTIEDYLYPETEKFLKHLKDKGEELVLASFGDIGWQKKKVDGLKKIKKLFTSIILEDKGKEENEALKELKNRGEKIRIINDNAKESLLLARELGQECEINLIKGPYSENIEHHEKIFNNIGEIMKAEEADKERNRETTRLK